MGLKLTASRISKAAMYSRTRYDPAMRLRSTMLKCATGRHYSQATGYADPQSKASPINLMYAAMSTLLPNIVSNDPRVKVRTNVMEYRPYADMLELATNHLLQRMDFKSTLRLVVMDAFFLAGFIKTGLATGQNVVTIDGKDYELGEPFAERVDPDDMIFDPVARAWDEQEILGSRVRVHVEDAARLGIARSVLRDLQSRYETQRYRHEAASITDKTRGQAGRELFNFVELQEVYIVRDGRVVYLPDDEDGGAKEFLHEVEWQGSDRGPLHMLGFTQIPDNLLPLPPFLMYQDLQTLTDRITRKLARQAEREKQVLAYEGRSADDAVEVSEAMDGEAIQVNHVDGLKEITFGEMSDHSYTHVEWLKRQFSEMAGSLDLLSGSSAAAPTATQSEMLQANLSVRLSDMQTQVHQFVSRVSREMGFYLHTDPLIELPLIRRERGRDTQVKYTSDMRRGEFFDYAFSVEPFSMARQDPNMRLRRLVEAFSVVLPAMAQASQVLGPSFKVDSAFGRVLKEIGVEDADEMFDGETYRNLATARALAELNPGKAGTGAEPAGARRVGSAPPSIRVGQPNPGQMGPTGGVGTGSERAAAAQEVAAQMQHSGEASARARALTGG